MSFTWQVAVRYGAGSSLSSLSSLPSHAFCLDTIEETDSNDPPFALYEKKFPYLDPSVGCNL